MTKEHTAEELMAILRDIGSRIGAYLDTPEEIRRKVIEHIQFAPRPEWPFIAPDGVRYDSPGSISYPKEHAYSKATALLHEFAAESQALRNRIETATGQHYVHLVSKGP